MWTEARAESQEPCYANCTSFISLERPLPKAGSCCMVGAFRVFLERSLTRLVYFRRPLKWDRCTCVVRIRSPGTGKG
jgi:hypothetical protein